MTTEPYPHTQPPAVTGEEKTASIVAHLSALIAAVVSAGWLSFVGPLIVWAIYKDKSPAVRAAAAGSFNFNVGLWVMNVVAWICVFTVILIPLAIILFIIANVGIVVFHLLAAFRTSQGRAYVYPFQIRILR